MEQWADVKGYEGYYKVSSQGRVSGWKGKVLNPQERRHGYLSVWLYAPGKDRVQVSVHRLVADAFCPNPNNCPEVNHINEDKKDNRAENLEWCSHVQNCHHGTAIRRRANKLRNGVRSKAVNQYTLGGKFIATYPSLAEAERQLGFGAGNILHCIQGRYSHAYGYIWRYA